MSYPFSIPVECQLATAEQSREMDSKTIHDFGIDGFTLMEIAASSAAGHIKKLQGSNKTGLYICGKGNNAGDALAVARYLVNDSAHKVFILFVLGTGDLSPDAEKNSALLEKLKDHGSDIEFIDDLQTINHQKIDYVVDGIFGTGLNSDLRDPLPAIVRKINSLHIPVYSMDVPSGLHADSGELLGGCIKADYTFTFGSNKLGLHWIKAKELCGEVIFVGLPFPSAYREWDTALINQTLMDAQPDIKRNAKHKYDGGVVHIMAGSAGLTGAAIMASKSSWKKGSGSVFLYVPQALMPVYESTLPHIIKISVGENPDNFFTEKHAQTILNSLQKKPGVFLAGPGIGTNEETGNCLINILKSFKGTAILDADALSFWDKINAAGISDEQKKRWLLTPHIGEASNYLDGNFQNDFERFQWAKKFTNQFKSSLLIKGNPTIFSTNGNHYITGYDTSMFSRAGFGDVLAGAIAANTAISENMELAVVSALYNGYKKFRQQPENEPFGPEHLL